MNEALNRINKVKSAALCTVQVNLSCQLQVTDYLVINCSSFPVVDLNIESGKVTLRFDPLRYELVNDRRKCNMW